MSYHDHICQSYQHWRYEYHHLDHGRDMKHDKCDDKLDTRAPADMTSMTLSDCPLTLTLTDLLTFLTTPIRAALSSGSVSDQLSLYARLSETVVIISCLLVIIIFNNKIGQNSPSDCDVSWSFSGSDINIHP